MAKIGKTLLNQLTSEGVTGPFLTFMLNTHVAHQDTEKEQLTFKNFSKEAKKRFEKKYGAEKWHAFQTKIDALSNDQNFWRSATTSVAIFLTETDTYIHRLSIRVDDQYYVSKYPYLLAIIKNNQFNFNYYILGLNRDSMKLYLLRDKKVSEIELPADAPTTIKIALGEEITGGNISFRSQGSKNGGRDSVAYHGVSAKDEEVEIDWVNYYQAVDTYLKESFDTEEKYPIYLYALPENQTMFKKVAKNSLVNFTAAVSSSPAQLSLSQIEKGIKAIDQELVKKETLEYQQLEQRKSFDQLSDVKQATDQGRVAQLFIATSNLITGFGENPETEYDWRQDLNQLAVETIGNGGEVFVLDQADAPNQKQLVAVLRY